MSHVEVEGHSVTVCEKEVEVRRVSSHILITICVVSQWVVGREEIVINDIGE